MSGWTAVARRRPEYQSPSELTNRPIEAVQQSCTGFDPFDLRRRGANSTPMTGAPRSPAESSLALRLATARRRLLSRVSPRAWRPHRPFAADGRLLNLASRSARRRSVGPHAASAAA